MLCRISEVLLLRLIDWFRSKCVMRMSFLMSKQLPLVWDSVSMSVQMSSLSLFLSQIGTFKMLCWRPVRSRVI